MSTVGAACTCKGDAVAPPPVSVQEARDARAARRLEQLERTGALAGRGVAELPNGMPVVELNRGETDYLYEELFVRQTYLRHGISLEPGACVFDAGANIGLFSLFVSRFVDDARIVAVEPAPDVFERLRLNAQVHELDASLYDCALGGRRGHCSFDYLPGNSILSGQHVDARADREVVAALLRSDPEAEDLPDDLIAELAEARLVPATLERPVRTISELIRDSGLAHVDLLKVDVEKAELDVLRGVELVDWPKIGQVVVEVHRHDGGRVLEDVLSLLHGHGFETCVEEDQLTRSEALVNVYARRNGGPEGGGRIGSAAPAAVAPVAPPAAPFPPIEKRATVIAIVGIDGAGKTSACSALSDWLRRLGVPTVAHPNESLRPAHRALLHIAMEAGYSDELEMLGPEVGKLCASLLKWNTMVKARRAIETPGQVVLMDRYWYCQIAAARQLHATNEWLLRKLFAIMPTPDLTLFVDVSPSVALERIVGRGEEPVPVPFLEQLVDAYRSLPEFPDFVRVDGNRPQHEVLASLRTHIADQLGLDAASGGLLEAVPA